MQENKIECCAYYRGEAGVYDSRRFDCKCKKYYDGLFKKIIYEYVKDANAILDAGTGTGRFAIYLAKKGKKVTALDQSAEMLDIAGQKSDEEGVSNRIEFVRGNIEELPFEEESFDAIVSVHVMVHFESIEKIIFEFSRVLKPGGVLVFDLSESRFARFYHFIRRCVFRKPFSFRDYFRKMSDVEKTLDMRNMVVETSKRVKVFPRFFVHLFTCVFNFESLFRILDKMEGANRGTVTLLKCTKRN